MSSRTNNNIDSHEFHAEEVIEEIKHFLPSQGLLKDFIHHNSLHAFQELKFFEAIFKASGIFGYQVTLLLDDYRNLLIRGRIKPEILERIVIAKKGESQLKEWKNKLLNINYETEIHPRVGRLRAHWKISRHFDLDNRVQPLLFRILSSYLDQGIAIFDFPGAEKGFLYAIRELEKNSFSSFFKTRRAKNLLFDESLQLKDLLAIVVGKESLYKEYLFDQQFSHSGWSGIVAAIETEPSIVLSPKKISLLDLIHFELLLEIDAIENGKGKNWKPLADGNSIEPIHLFSDVPVSELQEVLTIWQEAFEWSYYDEVLSGLTLGRNTPSLNGSKRSFQAIFCIDERECSIRRHVESVAPSAETLGCPGFFGVEFFFLPEGGKFYEKLCPAPVTPKYLVKEFQVKEHRKSEIFLTQKSHTLIGGVAATFGLGALAGIKLMLDLVRPKMTPAIADAFSHMGHDSKLVIECSDPPQMENGLQVGYTIVEMTNRVEGLLKSIGLKNFAPIVYIIAHGSSSANNPHHGAHDCGACSGRPGATNSRVFCMMANHPKVRAELAQRGIVIPETTHFLAGLHDTASDIIGFYDEVLLPKSHVSEHLENKVKFERALDLNAKERSRRFAAISTTQSLAKVRKAIENRSVSYFEPRPELGHGTNALCIVGRRQMTKGVFLDRRAFLNSYDYTTDPEGKILLGVMRPLGVVCGGINLEYYFSRVDNLKLGAGTKIPHNVIGLIGVANSSDGDLRPGLPLQMIEVHDPVRLLLLVEHFPDVVLKTVQSDNGLYEWFKNEWVHLMAIHPETGEYFYFKNEAFHLYTPEKMEIPPVKDFPKLFEEAKEMVTNEILDATEENLPVYLIK